jgi:hypothetical protein
VQTFDATFEQHCEGGNPAARGEVHISNPSPPAAAPKHATTTSPHATPTGGPGATADQPSATADRPGATVGSDTPASIVAADASAAPAVVRSAFRAPRLLMTWVVVAWVVFVAAGAVATGTVMAVRHP